ncbi:MAG: lysA, partial [Geminicoccaceae bacterium]|nr:lysA [Geminicoccaceae bacterium]
AGELERALAAGVPPRRIVFSGVGKSRDEMILALDARIAQFNVESVPELVVLGEVAAARKLAAPVALRINPDVAAGAHDKISTGRRHDKFGIAHDQALAVYDLARRLAGIEIVGLHLHIGSQILSLAPFAAAFRRGMDLVAELRRAGIPIRRLDLGGGLGVRYRPGPEPELDLAGYARLVGELTAGQDLPLPGAGRRHEQPAAAGALRCLPRHSAGRRTGRRRGAAPGGRGRPDLRIDRRVRARARSAAPCGR